MILALALWRLLPEGPARNAVRRCLYRVRVGIPRELLINPGDVVVQVGMWRTDSVTRAASLVGSSGRLVLIEASAEAAQRAEDYFAEQGLDNCLALHAAAWHCNATLELQLATDASGHQVKGVEAEIPHAKTGESLPVQGVRLDDVAAEHGLGTVDYLEVTVNGAELNVLRGAESMLPRVTRVLAAGMMRDPDSGEPVNRVVSAYLRSQGFRTVVSRQGRSINEAWGRIDGHVFAVHR